MIDWALKDLKKNEGGPKVFGTFICGGGSSMGYKLAGCNHLGGIEIDPKMAAMYQINHKPEILINKDIRDSFDDVGNLGEIDVFDGSPPCSSFSMSGAREKGWGKDKVFREGQAKQRLDDLFFTFIEMAGIIQPKVIVAENVTGIVKGNAKAYCRKIIDELKSIGYKTQIFKINGITSGIAQARERIVFIAQKQSKFKEITLNKVRERVVFADIDEGDVPRKKVSDCDGELWKIAKPGESLSKYHPKGNNFSSSRVDKNKPIPTLTAHCKFYHHKHAGFLTDEELRLLTSFPVDYDFNGNKVQYVCGMSVPPYMMRDVAECIREQVFYAKG